MLIVRYKPWTLQNATPHAYSPDLTQVPKPPRPDDNFFYRTRHVYNLPASKGNKWLAVAVKGFRRNILFQDIAKVGLFSYAFWSQSDLNPQAAQAAGKVAPAQMQAPNAPDLQAYAFPLAVAAPSCNNPSCEGRSEGTGTDDGSNFLMVSSNAASGKELRIDPVKVDPNLEQYAAEAAWSTPLPPIDPVKAYDTGVRYVYTVTISSGHIITAFDLNLLENTRVGIHATSTVSGLNQSSAWAVAHLFPPGNGVYPKSLRHEIADNNQDIRVVIPAGQGGAYGLALELPGDKTAFDICDDCNRLDVTPSDRMIQVTLTVQVCPLNAIPTDTGCARVIKPDWTNTDLWREVPPYRIFSPAGFGTCGTDVCSNRYVGDHDHEYATILTWGAEVARFVVISGDRYTGDHIAYYPQDPKQVRLTAFGRVTLGKSGPGDTIDPTFEVGYGLFSAGFSGSDYGFFIDHYGCEANGDCRGLLLSDYDLNNAFNRNPSPVSRQPSLRISVAQSADDATAQYAQFTANIIRPVQTVSGVQNQELQLSWRVQAEGYRGWLESPGGLDPGALTVTPVNTVASVPVAGLTYTFAGGWDAYYDPVTGYFTPIPQRQRAYHPPAGIGWSLADGRLCDSALWR